MIDYVKSCVEDFAKFLLVTDQAASRLVYLIQGIAVAVCVILVTVAYTHTKDTAEGYCMYVGMLLGGGGLFTAARGYYKGQISKGEGKGDATTESPK